MSRKRHLVGGDAAAEHFREEAPELFGREAVQPLVAPRHLMPQSVSIVEVFSYTSFRFSRMNLSGFLVQICDIFSNRSSRLSRTNLQDFFVKLFKVFSYKY